MSTELITYQEFKNKPLHESISSFRSTEFTKETGLQLLLKFAADRSELLHPQHLGCGAAPAVAKHTPCFSYSDRAISPLNVCVPFQRCEVPGAGHSSHWEALCLHLSAATHHIRRPSTAAHDGLWWVLGLAAQQARSVPLVFFFFFAKTRSGDLNLFAFQWLYDPSCSLQNSFLLKYVYGCVSSERAVWRVDVKAFPLRCRCVPLNKSARLTDSLLVCSVDVGAKPKGEKIPHEQQIKFFGKVWTHPSFDSQRQAEPKV